MLELRNDINKKWQSSATTSKLTSLTTQFMQSTMAFASDWKITLQMFKLVAISILHLNTKHSANLRLDIKTSLLQRNTIGLLLLSMITLSRGKIVVFFSG